MDTVNRELLLQKIYQEKDSIKQVAWGRICEYTLFVIRKLPEQFSLDMLENTLFEHYRSLGRAEQDGFFNLSEEDKGLVISFVSSFCRG